MSLRFIIGRAGSGKTSYCLNEIQKDLKNTSDIDGHNIIVIVPEQSTFQYEKMLLKDLDGFMRLQVMSFERLALSVMQETGGIAKTQLTDLGELMLTRQIIVAHQQDLNFLKDAIDRFGFVGKISQAINELKEYDVQVNTLKEILKKSSDFDSALKEKLKDLTLVYEKIQECKEDYIMVSDYIDVLIDKLPESEMLKGAKVWIDGFYYFKPKEINAIISMANYASEVNVVLTFDEKMIHKKTANSDFDTENYLFKMPMTSFLRLSKLAKSNGIAIEILPIDKQLRFKSSGIAHLEKSFFNLKSDKCKDAEGIYIKSAENPRSEVESIVLEINRLCQSGMRYKDIAVLFRDIEGYDALVQTIFTKYDIPFFMDVERASFTHPLIELIRASLEVVKSGWRYESVLKYLKTGLVNIKADELFVLENYVLKYGITGKNNWQGGDKWHIGENNSEFICDIKVRATKELLEFDKAVEDANSILEILKALYGLLEKLKVPGVIERWANEALYKGNLEEAQQHQQIWDRLMEILEQLAEIAKNFDKKEDKKQGRKLLNDIAEILDAAFENLNLSLIPPSLDQVIVGTLNRTMNIEAKAVFVAGVNDGILPARVQKDGLLSEEEKTQLKKFGIDLPTQQDRLSDEQFFIYTAITRTKEKLYFSYSLSDLEGKTLKPSYMIKRIKSIFCEISEDYYRENKDIDECEIINLHPQKQLMSLIFKLRDFIARREIDPFWWDIYNSFLENEKWRKKLKLVINGLFWQSKAVRINRELIRKLYGDRLITGISGLEKFKSCPFAYFIDYMLNLKEREIYKLTPIDLGLFFHSAMEKFSKKLLEIKRDWADLNDTEINSIADEVVDEIKEKMQKQVLQSSARYKYLTDKFKRTVVRSASALSEHARRSEFRPVKVEAEFGTEGNALKLKIELKDKIVMKLCGRIDRIDGCEHDGKYYFRVIDYKSGRASFDLLGAYYGIQLQLIAYLYAVQKNFDKLIEVKENFKDIVPAAMLYFQLKNPTIEIKNKNPFEAQIDEILKQEMLKKFKMNGLVLAEEEAFRLMDKETQKGYSPILPVGISSNVEKDESSEWKEKLTFYSNSNTYTREQLNALFEHLERLMKEIGSNITDGIIDIAPFKLRDLTACDLCNFKSICQFDISIDGNEYKLLGAMDKEKIWERLCDEE